MQELLFYSLHYNDILTHKSEVRNLVYCWNISPAVGDVSITQFFLALCLFIYISYIYISIYRIYISYIYLVSISCISISRISISYIYISYIYLVYLSHISISRISISYIYISCIYLVYLHGAVASCRQLKCMGYREIEGCPFCGETENLSHNYIYKLSSTSCINETFIMYYKMYF